MQVLCKEFIAADRHVADRAGSGQFSANVLFIRKVDAVFAGSGRTGASSQGTRVARFWCPRASTSISLLPAFLAARMSGTLDAVEAAVLTVEQAGSVASAVEQVHPASAERAMRIRYRGHSLDVRLTHDSVAIYGRERGAQRIQLAWKNEVHEFAGGSTRVFEIEPD